MLKMKTNIRKVIIFGASKRLQEIIDNLQDDIELIAIADNNMDKWNKLYLGISIISPKQIIKMEFDYVYIIPYSYNPIIQQLLDLGVSREKIVDERHIELIVNKIPSCFFESDFSNINYRHKAVLFSHRLNSSGAQNVLFNLARELKKMKFQVTIVSPEDGQLREGLVEEGFNIAIIRDIYVHFDEIEEMVINADFVLVNTIWLVHIAFELAKIKREIIWWLHESMEIEFVDKNVFAYLKNNDCRIMAVSELVKEEVEKKINLECNIKIVRFFIPEYRVNHNKSSKIRFIVIAAMDYIKGQDVFIKAVSMLSRDKKNNAEFLLIGGGELTPKLTEISNKEGIIILNEISPYRIKEIYENVDVIVCSSRKEAMSVTIAEAWMHGMPTIVSDAAGISRYVNDKEALIFESEDAKALSECITWIIENYADALEMGKRSRNLYEKYFSKEAFYIGWNDLICRSKRE